MRRSGTSMRAQGNSQSRKELTGRHRRWIFVLGSIQVGLALAAWLDLARRSSDQIKGNKRTWAAVICVNFVGPIAYFVCGRRRASAPSVEPVPEVSATSDEAPIAHSAASSGLQSDSIAITVPDALSPSVFPVTTATSDGVVQAVVVGEYGPVAGTAPEGTALRTAVLSRWPRARIFERRTTSDGGADPRGYEVFYLELCADGTRRDVDTDEVSALFA
jgi:hypothetical protein